MVNISMLGQSQRRQSWLYRNRIESDGVAGGMADVVLGSPEVVLGMAEVVPSSWASCGLISMKEMSTVLKTNLAVELPFMYSNRKSLLYS